MDLFKLFYNHDQRLDNLSRSNDKTKGNGQESSLQDFLSPTPIYSSFYLMGTHFPEEKIGLNRLEKYDQIVDCLQNIFEDQNLQPSTKADSGLVENIKQMAVGSAIILSRNKESVNSEFVHQVITDQDKNQRNEQLRKWLAADNKVLFKEEARDGCDLYLFSRENIYPQLFHPFQELVDDSFRFFSVNSKRMRSQRHFYFDTWRLDRPPHGAEEVFEDTILRSKR